MSRRTLPGQLGLFSRRLEPGAVVATSYGTGPYVVDVVRRGCTCPEYVRSLSGDRTPSPPHVHLVCYEGARRDKNRRWLNGYDEATLRSVWGRDELYVLEGSPS